MDRGNGEIGGSCEDRKPRQPLSPIVQPGHPGERLPRLAAVAADVGLVMSPLVEAAAGH